MTYHHPESVDSQLVQKYLDVTGGLWPVIPHGSAKVALHRESLPRLTELIRELTDGHSGLLRELWHPMKEATQYAMERKDWAGLLSLSLVRYSPDRSMDRHGIIYVKKLDDSYKETVDWFVTGELDKKRREPQVISTPRELVEEGYQGAGMVEEKVEPKWKEAGLVTLIEPVKFYEDWQQVKGDDPIATFESVDEILGYNGMEEHGFLVFPKVRLRGLPITTEEYFETPMNIQSFFGKVLVSEKPTNPSWDL